MVNEVYRLHRESKALWGLLVRKGNEARGELGVRSGKRGHGTTVNQVMYVRTPWYSFPFLNSMR